ncbi:hypothetical protein AU509_02260 [Lonsdalea britannica]|uniref:Uncharacterized protein n=1 Tax=Lonsdalea britannica TaxID=1082704 RepID=A0AAD0SHU2_9GAMM|nr:hypothetical protein CKQ53_14625 [Lonsdalea britannica]OSN00251.1 hypothetical protein AU509_02260 [Lonsdalea britannica]OSN02831.1 hypothetical protein AU510_16605 [Lonsdalea britannica]
MSMRETGILGHASYRIDIFIDRKASVSQAVYDERELAFNLIYSTLFLRDESVFHGLLTFCAMLSLKNVKLC